MYRLGMVLLALLLAFAGSVPGLTTALPARADSTFVGVSLTIELAMPEQAAEPLVAAEGSFDADTNVLSLLVDPAPDVSHPLDPIVHVLTPDWAYVQSPILAESLQIDTPWFSYSRALEDQAAGMSWSALAEFTSAAINDLDAAIALAERVAADVEPQGAETVRGVATTHYLMMADASEMIEDSGALISDARAIPTGPYTVELWLDANGLPYRIRFALDATTVGFPEGTLPGALTFTFEFFPTVEPPLDPPNPAAVIDLTVAYRALVTPTLPFTLPPDSLFPQQWALHNYGQLIGGEVAGTPGADICAPEAWMVSQGEGVIIAVIDTGVDPQHPAIAPNLWQNPGEQDDGRESNTVDDDGNGYVDDWWGWDFVANDNDPRDQGDRAGSAGDLTMHGTSVASIAAGAAHGTGTVGVAPRAQIMALRAQPGGDTLWAEAIQYAAANSARIVNLSVSTGIPL